LRESAFPDCHGTATAHERLSFRMGVNRSVGVPPITFLSEVIDHKESLQADGRTE